ncbi:MAG TPA: glycogen/starch synthase [Roseiflexaceae bacterium]
MNVLFVAAEVAPLIKTGGLADVAGALPPALRQLGHDARIVMPRYRRLNNGFAHPEGPAHVTFLPVGDGVELMRVFTTRIGDTPVYLLDIPAAFDRDTIFGDGDDDRRFVLFTRGVLALMLHLREIDGWQPDVVHANDWHVGLLPNYLKTFYAHAFPGVASVYTIHNLAYQGFFSPFTLYLAGIDGGGEPYINYMARGIQYADVVSTVSPTYAQEILTPEYGEHLDGLLRLRQDHLAGIINGIDDGCFDPATDPQIAANYCADDVSGKAACKAALQRESGFAVDPRRPLLGMISRLVPQKGLDLLDAAIPWLVGQTDAQLVLLGSGDAHVEQAFAEHMRRHPDRVSVQLRFDAALAQRIYAGCDVFLMPSRYEPCGLGQLIALRYGTIPIARATGGLNDTVREGHDGNGFRYHHYETGHLIDAIARCLACFRDTSGWAILRERGMREDHSWAASAREYVGLYEWAVRERGKWL